MVYISKSCSIDIDDDMHTIFRGSKSDLESIPVGIGIELELNVSILELELELELNKMYCDEIGIGIE